MAISQEQVEHIARLARIELQPEELPHLREQLGQILGYVDQLSELDTSHVSPASHALPLNNVFREDHAEHQLSQTEIFQNAPDLEGEFFRVPQIMSEEV